MDRALLPRSLAALLAAAVIVTPRPAHAQPAAWGPLALGLAGAVGARDDGRLAAYNPAAAGAIERLVYAEGAMSVGGLSGLGEGMLGAVVRIDSARALTLSLGGVGYGAYRLVALASSASLRVNGALSVGAGARIEAQTIVGYSTSATILLDAGASYRIAPSASVGVAARNVTGAELRDIARPQQLSIGALAQAADSIDLSFELLHETGRDVSLGIGAVLGIDGGLEARGGVRLDGSIFALGLGYDDQGILVDIALAWIEALGARAAVGVGSRW